jgi:hypothetical protein
MAASAGAGPTGAGAGGVSGSRRGGGAAGGSHTYDKLQYGDLVAFYVEDKVSRIILIGWAGRSMLGVVRVLIRCRGRPRI